MSRRFSPKPVLLALAMLGAGLAGCTTSADVSYTEFRAGPGFVAERTYSNSVYGDAEDGLGAEACRTTVQRRYDMFGAVRDREVTTCDGY